MYINYVYQKKTLVMCFYDYLRAPVFTIEKNVVVGVEDWMEQV